MIIDHALRDMIYDHHDFLEPYVWAKEIKCQTIFGFLAQHVTRTRQDLATTGKGRMQKRSLKTEVRQLLVWDSEIIMINAEPTKSKSSYPITICRWYITRMPRTSMIANEY